jgi:phosphatidylethanolamine-binding protein (PEBP) family uncharacterized protein
VATSTRASLVLVAVVLAAFSGCGGGSDSAESASTATGPGTREGDRAGGAPPASTPDRESASPASRDTRSTVPPSTSGESTTGKQGSRIGMPKGPQEPAPTPEQRAEATVASIALASPGLRPGPESISQLPASYTCDGKDTSPALEWKGVPAGTTELALFVLNVEPVDEALFFDWAVTGIDPALSGLESGHLPKGAIVGSNSFGDDDYSICPSNGKETYIFALYALPERIAAKPGFDSATLRKAVLASSGNGGLMAVSYP